ncbi:MAG: hypothetical protein P4K83_08775 [Terracidiphilus sp.]|nr:hypothetical protein [Terracidiphilus sp.]
MSLAAGVLLVAVGASVLCESAQAQSPARTETAQVVKGGKPEVSTAPAQPPEDECAQLLALANELKTAMDKATKDMLSITVVRKAEEIEKLAHRMRSK